MILSSNTDTIFTLEGIEDIDAIKYSDGSKTITHIQLKYSIQRQDASFMDSVLKNYLETYLIDKNRHFKLVYDFSVATGNLSKLFSGNLDKNSKDFWKTKIDNIKRKPLYGIGVISISKILSIDYLSKMLKRTLSRKVLRIC